MQREKASGPLTGADPAEVVEEGPPPPHAAARTVRPAAAMMAAAVRAPRGHARRGRHVIRVVSFIMPSSGLDDRSGT